MSSTRDRRSDLEKEALKAKHRSEKAKHQEPQAGSLLAPESEAQALTDPRFALDANLGRQAEVVQSLQQSHGNAYVQRLMAPGKGGAASKDEYPVSEGISQRIEAAKGSGQSLDPKARAQMEPSFDRDFSDVRVHTGPEANRLAEQVQADAFTTGKDVFFGEGNYAPDSAEGKQLLAHELTHVTQQGHGAPTLGQVVSQPSDAAEQEATTVAAVLAAGPDVAVTVNAAPAAAIQRQGGETPPWAPLPRSEGPSPAPAPGVGGGAARTAEPEQRYNLRIGPDRLENVTQAQAIAVLRRHYSRIRGWTEAEMAGHQRMQGIREEQYIVGFFSDLLGGASMPSIGIWDDPIALLDVAKVALDASYVEALVDCLRKAEAAYVRCHRQYYEYKEGTIKGAERSVTTLEVTSAVLLSVSTTVLTGGAAAVLKTGLLGTAALGAGVSGGAAVVKELAVEGSEYLHGVDPEFNWRRFLTNVGASTVAGFTSGLVSGALRPAFLGRFVKWNCSDETLAAVNEVRKITAEKAGVTFKELTKEAIKSYWGPVGARLLATIPASAFAEAFRATVQVMGTEKPASMDDFWDLYLKNLERQGLGRTIGQILLSFA